ncbi:MAG TPA: hypothetical protein VE871_19615 [Longimicrobium sp.]|nr:hypothetical protein [Longimicrobium sp.]
MTPASLLRIAALASLAALPAAAQDRAAPPAEIALATRMRAFAAAAPGAPNDSVAAFFPRRGDWTWVHTRRPSDRRGAPRVGTWRFGGVETLRAIGAGGPVCHSFDGPAGWGPYEGRLGMQMLMHRGPWRHVRGTRFVPAGEPAASPVFVEWQREDGAWVVSAFGDVGVYDPPLPGRRAPAAWRDTTGVPEDAAFAPADWYTVTLNGLRYTKYGNPRPLNEADRARVARIGLYQGVSVFARRDEDPGLASARIPAHGARTVPAVRVAPRGPVRLPVGAAEN